jgi:hypothetical protein
MFVVFYIINLHICVFMTGSTSCCMTHSQIHEMNEYTSVCVCVCVRARAYARLWGGGAHARFF